MTNMDAPFVVQPEKRLDIVHDHYKETFGYIRSREQSRDRLFVIVIVLFGALAVQTQYPAAVGNGSQSVTLAGLSLDFEKLPLPALMDATWAALLAVSLKYCQLCVTIERQYVYLHSLERVVNEVLGANLYTREGSAYLNGYPVLLNWAWICYVFVFPVLVVFATAALQISIWNDLDYRWPHEVFGACCAAAVVLSFFFYRVAPYVAERRRESPTRESPESENV